MAALFANSNGEGALAVLGAATGIDPENLPERVDETNNLLNQLRSPVRDKLLADFVNRLYANR